MSDRALFRKTLAGFAPFNDEAETCEHSGNLLGGGRAETLRQQRPALTTTSDRSARMAALPLTPSGALRQPGAEVDCSTKGHPTARIIIDGEDFEWVSSRKWTPADNGKGCVYFYSVRGRQKIALHREIARARFYEHVDHRNGDTFDNRKENLRTCTRQQNTWNQTAHAAGNCRFKGVHRLPSGRHKAYISKDYVVYNLGSYDTAKDAALAYDAAALALHGEFAFLNFPDSGIEPKAPRPPRKNRTLRRVG